jgi:DNA-binding GntR family transcriptional regulator
VKYCKNEYLARMLHGLEHHIQRIRSASKQQPGKQVFASHREHKALLKAMAARDAQRARELAEEHILRGAERLAGLMQSRRA